MKKIKFFFVLPVVILIFVSCLDKTPDLLCKKWDCIKIENLDPINKIFQSPQDSIAAANMEIMLQSLSWNFTKNRQYQCSINDKIITAGTYQLTDKGKSLVCTTNSKNTTNQYAVTSLTADELILTSSINNISLIMYFKPH